jgi:hypothetical protein
MRQRPGRPRRVGDGDPRGIAQPREHAPQPRRHPFLAAVEMRDAAQVEEERVAALDRHRWGPAPRQCDREAGEMRAVAFGIGAADVEPGELRARLCQRHAGCEPQRRGGGIGGGDDNAVAFADAGDEGHQFLPGTGRGAAAEGGG